MVQRAQVKVARLVPGDGGGVAVLVGLKEEEFQLRTDVEGVKAHVLRPLQHPAQHAPRVAHKGGAVRIVYVADQPGHPSLRGPPREDGKAVQIGVQALVRLVDAGVPLDGGAVEHNLVVHRLFDLRGSDGHVFQLTENIHELHPDKFNVLLLHQADDVFLGVAHSGSLLSIPSPPCTQAGKPIDRASMTPSCRPCQGPFFPFLVHVRPFHPVFRKMFHIPSPGTAATLVTIPPCKWSRFGVSYEHKVCLFRRWGRHTAAECMYDNGV